MILQELVLFLLLLTINWLSPRFGFLSHSFVGSILFLSSSFQFASKDTTSDSLRLLQEQAPARHNGHKIGETFFLPFCFFFALTYWSWCSRCWQVLGTLVGRLTVEKLIVMRIHTVIVMAEWLLCIMVLLKIIWNSSMNSRSNNVCDHSSLRKWPPTAPFTSIQMSTSRVNATQKWLLSSSAWTSVEEWPLSRPHALRLLACKEPMVLPFSAKMRLIPSSLYFSVFHSVPLHLHFLIVITSRPVMVLQSLLVWRRTALSLLLNGLHSVAGLLDSSRCQMDNSALSQPKEFKG